MSRRSDRLPPAARVRGVRARLAGALVALAVLALPAGIAAQAAAPAQAAAAKDGDGARALIQDTAERVIALLNDSALTSDQRRERIIELVDQRIDVGVVTRLVLAKHYKRFTPEQEAAFRKEFRHHLIATYYRNAETAKVKSIDIYESRGEKDGDWTVRSRVRSVEQGETLIDYRVRRSKDTGAWLIIDISIEQVSLVSNFRSQFKEILSTRGPEELIAMLREKNAKADSGAEGEGGPSDPPPPKGAPPGDGK
jgi:phospholipid transport system substrate-binding protein